MSENEKSGIRTELAVPAVISFIMAIIIFLTPAIIHTHNYLILKSMTWEIRIDPGEPLRATVMLGELFAFEYIIKYLFLLMAYRLYRNETTLSRTLLVGIISEVFLFVTANSGTIIVDLMGIGRGYYEFPLPIAVIAFLIMAKLIPYPKDDLDTKEDAWLINTQE